MTVEKSPPTSAPPSPRWSNVSSPSTDDGWTTVTRSPDLPGRKKNPQRQRFYSAGCESSAKKTLPKKNPAKKKASDTSNWWRSPNIPQKPKNRTRFVLASRALFSPDIPIKASPIASPQIAPNTEKQSSENESIAKKFVLVPRESINQRIVTTEKTNAGVTVTLRQASNQPGHGWLQDSCREIFCQAYGLDGFERVDHRDLYKQLVEKCQCSRRSFLELLYGHSYQDKLGELREQVINYPAKVSVNKKQSSSREAMLERLAIEMNIVHTEQDTTQDTTPKKTTHAEKGHLEGLCVNLFCRAYGLNGFQKEDHNELYKEAVEKSQCSRRAFLECLYGHSYSTLLSGLRQEVSNYPAKIQLNKKDKKDRQLILEHLSVVLNSGGEFQPKAVSKSPPLRATAPIYTPHQSIKV